jgi:hypothetical protein
VCDGCGNIDQRPSKEALVRIKDQFRSSKTRERRASLAVFLNTHIGIVQISPPRIAAKWLSRDMAPPRGAINISYILASSIGAAAAHSHHHYRCINPITEPHQQEQHPLAPMMI